MIAPSLHEIIPANGSEPPIEVTFVLAPSCLWAGSVHLRAGRQSAMPPVMVRRGRRQVMGQLPEIFRSRVQEINRTVDLLGRRAVLQLWRANVI